MNGLLPSRLAVPLWGFLLTVAGMFITGGALSTQYRPDPSQITTSFRPAIESGVWKWIAAAHYWGSATCLVMGALCLLALFLGGLDGPARRVWWPTLFALGCCLGLQILGNLLPMDGHDVRTANVEVAVAARTPLIGTQVTQFLLDGPAFTPATLHRWYGLTLPTITALALCALWIGWALMRQKREKLGMAERLLVLLLAAVPYGLTLLPKATGTVFTLADFSSQAAAPSWYVLPMHDLLRLFESIDPHLGWIGSALIPGLGAFAALTAPFWSAKLKPAVRRNLVLIGIGGGGALIGLSGAKPAPISGSQDDVVGSIYSTKDGGAIDEAMAAKGRDLFNANCAACHGVNGAGGSVGPNLRQIQLKTTDPDRFVEFVKNPAGVKPGSTMPSIATLQSTQLRAIAEWLRSPSK